MGGCPTKNLDSLQNYAIWWHLFCSLVANSLYFEGTVPILEAKSLVVLLFLFKVGTFVLILCLTSERLALCHRIRHCESSPNVWCTGHKWPEYLQEVLSNTVHWFTAYDWDTKVCLPSQLIQLWVAIFLDGTHCVKELYELGEVIPPQGLCYLQLKQKIVWTYCLAKQ